MRVVSSPYALGLLSRGDMVQGGEIASNVGEDTHPLARRCEALSDLTQGPP